MAQEATKQEFSLIDPAFIQSAAVMPIDQLAKKYLAFAEARAEDECHAGRDYATRILTLLDAIGNLRWPDVWRPTASRPDFLSHHTSQPSKAKKKKPALMRESDILYENGRFWVAREHYGFAVYEVGVTHSTRVASIGFKGDTGYLRAKAETDRRAALTTPHPDTAVSP